ncbi:TrbC/VirB2 family protein [Bartonella sp. A05]|uniref:TrbC/VirB2 family protein n=1 Tax=Bartonella sp. A05 TaxID=2967261 RepID=UPI0022A9BAF1|nr:TrbC/VirB2 family protein [Bartonella sp. A05]MCZ2204486.1 TrbC/VirB2 family protein [Bartonella sp. A05]
MLKVKNRLTYSQALQEFTTLDKQKKYLTTVFMLFISLIMLSDPAFAQGFDRVQNSLDRIVETLTGPIARSIAIIAVAGVGLAWISGYIEMRKAFFVCVGIGIVFGAPQIVAMLAA